MVDINKKGGSAKTDWAEELASALHDHRWRQHCHRDLKQHSKTGELPIPSGITYLSQLMAHDMIMSVRRGNAFSPRYSRSPDGPFINLVDPPLLLNTVYGQPGMADQLVFDQHNSDHREKFISTPFDKDGIQQLLPGIVKDRNWSYSHPVLADQRNFSSPILTQITAEFMFYHNRIIDGLIALGVPTNLRFGIARSIVVRTWHRIICHEVLPTVAISPIGNSERLNKLPKELASILNNAVFRSFHSLVLKRYEFNSGSRQNSKDMLSIFKRAPHFTGDGDHYGIVSSVNSTIASNWHNEWGVDWKKFFDNAPGQPIAVNRTGFTPSFVFSRDAKPIALLDAKNGMERQVASCKGLGFTAEITARLCQNLDEVLETGDKWQNWAANNEISPFLALSAQGYFENPKNGKLGSLASALLLKRMNSALRAARNVMKKSPAQQYHSEVWAEDKLPNSFLGMVNETQLNFIIERNSQ